MRGDRCSWQFSFRREGQKRLGIKALHRELIFLDLSADSVGIQNPKPVSSIDSVQTLSNAEGPKIQNRLGEVGGSILSAKMTR
jgi:hypothetical protein